MTPKIKNLYLVKQLETMKNARCNHHPVTNLGKLGTGRFTSLVNTNEPFPLQEINKSIDAKRK